MAISSAFYEGDLLKLFSLESYSAEIPYLVLIPEVDRETSMLVAGNVEDSEFLPTCVPTEEGVAGPSSVDLCET